MKDSDLRALVLKAFYDQRKDGNVGVNTRGVPPLNISVVDIGDVLRICSQLAENALIEWKTADGRTGNPVAGVGMITAYGVDVIEGEEEAPIPIHMTKAATYNTSISRDNTAAYRWLVPIATSNSPFSRI